jgi:hypothetical protein
MSSTGKVLLRKSLFSIFFFSVFSFISLNNLYSQILQSNPDSIPFAPAVNYAVGSNPRSIFCADLDGDGDLDLTTANEVGSVSILKNNGNGTFQLKADYGAGSWSSSVFCADLDGDNDLDLAVANQNSDNVSILINLSDPYFIRGDADGDGVVDVGGVVYLINCLFKSGLAPSC